MGYYERKVGKLLSASARNDIAGIDEAFKSTRTFFNEDSVSPADINGSDSAGSTALMYAANNGSREALQYLLSKGANPNLKNKEGKTALMLAAEKGFKDIIADLLAKNAKIDEVDNKGRNALMHAAENSQSHIVKFLIAQNALLDEACYEGKTALMRAAAKGDSVSVNALLDTGRVAIDARDNNSDSALMWAAYAEKKNTVEDLLKRDARADFANNDGKTARNLTSTSVIQVMLESHLRKVALGEKEKTPEPEGEEKNAPMTVSDIVILTPQDKIRAAMEREGLDPSQSEHWLPIGNAAIEYIMAGTDSPKMLSNSFNFAAKQYVTTNKNMLTGENASVLTGNLDSFPNQELVAQAHGKLVALGKTPPPLTLLKSTKKPAL